jgi:hypothetical protein
MRERWRLSTVLLALPFLAAGFALGGAVSAWRQREARTDSWRKMHVEHEGIEGVTTRTRVVFENPKLALQAVEMTRSPEGSPELARVVQRDGSELTVRYQKDKRPSSLEARDGSRAVITYEGEKARVDFFGPDKKDLGTKVVTVPVELRSALRHARAGRDETGTPSELWERFVGSLIREARAQDADDAVSVVRHVEVRLEIRVPGGGAGATGIAQVEASCTPFTCVPVTPDVPVPGQTTVRVAVTGKAKRAELPKPSGSQALEPFKRRAAAERAMARRVVPDVSGVVAAVGLTASACKSLKLTTPMCVPELAKSTTAGAAIHAISTYVISTSGRVVDARAEELYYVEQARAKLDRELSIQVCLSREGYARTCTDVGGRPLGVEPPPRADRSLDMRRGIGGTLAGSFVVSQHDGPDCKFSPSPQTGGALRLTFDNEHNVATAALRADQRGTRPDMRCSLGTANMGWSQTYSITATQSFTPQELQSGGKLPLRLTGTMNGVGSYNFSNCRTSGGASANCPAGKSDNYSYPVELVGELDLGTQKGSGRIVVTAPLDTKGTWQIPAGETP